MRERLCFRVCGVIALSLLCGCASPAARSPIRLGQHPERLDTTITQRVRCDYLLYLPQDYAERKDEERFPLIIFLHGAGERGSDLTMVTRHGPPKLLPDKRDFPFVVVSPQCPAEQWWDITVLSLLLDEVLLRYAVDPDRVYLTGLSMGGYGTWEWASLQPERFAAIVPICGGGRRYAAPRLKNLPIWAFHGAKDTVVSLSQSQEMVDAIKQAGGDAKLTIYPDATHDSWTRTYDNPELYAWFLKHHRGQPARP
ncbi:MAG: prolyl oligopeptidase family serine peptidase [Phycisphaerae bacterium]|nr:prolyl oligopeptidase family serine peptidase [Phycisphaerae bacterium]